MFRYSQFAEFILIHILAVTGLFFLNWINVATALILFWITLGWGVAIGYHRLITHRSFSSPKWIEYTLAVIGSLAHQGGPIAWVTTHRIHHAFTELDHDPHSPRDGFLWSHIGWMVIGTGLGHSLDVSKKYCPDLMRNSFYPRFEQVHRIPTLLLAIGLYLVGGFGLFAWGVGVRTILSWHFTWAVNSFGHSFGSQRFVTNDDSRNNWVVGILTFGEGWHNNHHAFPRSVRHGLSWYELDINYMQIRTMSKLGLAKLKTLPSERLISAKAVSKET